MQEWLKDFSQKLPLPSAERSGAARLFHWLTFLLQRAHVWLQGSPIWLYRAQLLGTRNLPLPGTCFDMWTNSVLCEERNDADAGHEDDDGGPDEAHDNPADAGAQAPGAQEFASSPRGAAGREGRSSTEQCRVAGCVERVRQSDEPSPYERYVEDRLKKEDVFMMPSASLVDDLQDAGSKPEALSSTLS